MKIPVTCKGSKTIPLNNLKDFQDDLKTLQPEELEKLKRSIIKYGFSFPVFVWKNSILDGHQRLQAVRSLIEENHTIEDIPVVEINAKNKTVAAEKLLLINSRYAEIEYDGLQKFIDENQVDLDSIIADLSIPDLDLSEFMAEPETEGLTDPDDVPEPPEEPVTKVGDIWILGDHRLMCGDSTNADDVARLMNENKIDLVFTSPPYDNQRQYNIKEEINWNGLMSGAFSHDIFSNDCQILVNLGLIHKDGEVQRYWDWFIDYMRENKWRFFGWYIWDKLNPLPGVNNGRLTLRHEWIFHFNKKNVKLNKILPCKHAGEKITHNSQRLSNGKLKKFGGIGNLINRFKSIESVIYQTPEQSGMGINHPAMFPVDLPKQIIVTFPSQNIYEPFSGSGTTIIAAEQTNRKCYAMEISPEYCDVAVKRWEEFTGKKAELA